MKKILLATTMLTATAGIASAEMSITGTARMGVVSDIVTSFDANGQSVHGYDAKGNAIGAIEAAFSSRFRVEFTGSGTTDGGLTFGATARADNSPIGVSFDSQSQLVAGGGATGNRWTTAGTVYLAGSFGTLTMGDTGNAADDLVGQVAYVGYTSLNSWNEIGNLDRNLTGVEYSYSMNGFTFALGSGQTFNPEASFLDGVGGLNSTNGAALYDQNGFWAIGAKYATDVFSVALGYQTSNAGDIVSASGSYTAAGFTGIVKIADDSRFSETLWALSAQYAMDGGIGLTAYYNHDQDGSPLGLGTAPDTTAGAAYGFGASYDLGGGASVVGGIAQRDNDGYGSILDVGVQMSF